jgi:hypothetical protein
MEIPSFRRILMSFGLIVVLYVVFLAGWLHLRVDYARGLASVATHHVFPLIGMEGGVTIRANRWIDLIYTVPDGRTGEWGAMAQRFLDFSDVALAAAASLGLLILGWRRRLMVLVGAVLMVSICHLGLIVWSACRFREILARPDLDVGTLDHLMVEASTQVTGFGNISSVVTLGIVGFLTALLVQREQLPAHDPH